MSRNHIYYVYILECKDNTLYVGVTNNLERRFKEHCDGACDTSYTYNRRPLKMVYQEFFQFINDAIAREKQLKGWSRKKKTALINMDIGLLKELSKKRFLF